MRKISKQSNIYVKICIMFFALFSLSKSLFAYDETKFKQIEATGRAVIVPDDIQVSRKRALEDALYIAALKGGADIKGFSAITSNTVINDQSVVTPTNRVIDFKIIKEEQDKDFLSIKISAIVGGKTPAKNCKIRPINITLFKGSYHSETNVPSKLARKMPVWYNSIYEIINHSPNVTTLDKKNTSLDQIIKSNINPSYDYNALANGLPYINAGNYSLFPELKIITNNQNNFYTNYILRVSLKIFKGNNFKLISNQSFNLPIKYKIKSKFQFIQNVSTISDDLVDNHVNQHLRTVVNEFFKDIYCRALEGKLSLVKGKLQVDIGKKQGLRDKQIGLVKGISIKNSMLSNSSVIVHSTEIFENYSVLSPLNDNVKLNSLDNLIVEFTE